MVEGAVRPALAPADEGDGGDAGLSAATGAARMWTGRLSSTRHTSVVVGTSLIRADDTWMT